MIDEVTDNTASGVSAVEFDEDRIARMKVAECELVERLRAALLVERERVEDEENDDDNNEDEDNEGHIALWKGDHRSMQAPEVSDNEEDDQETSIIYRRRATQQCTLLTFKDVEVTLKKLNGDDHTDVWRWLRKFEEMDELCGWNDVQKVAYAKWLWEGSAELFW